MLFETDLYPRFIYFNNMIPNLLWKAKIPDNIPKSMQVIVNRLKKSRSKEDCLRKAYSFLSKKYYGCAVYTLPFDLFITDLYKLWDKDMSHCTNLNYLLRVLLIKSSFFKEEDISLKLTLIGYVSVHQYLRIRIKRNKFVNVDLWGSSHDTKLGNYAHGFHYSTFRKISKKLKNFIPFFSSLWKKTK